MRRALRVLWTIAFVVGFVLILLPGNPEELQRPGEVLAGFLIAAGTILGFARPPNRRARFAADEDLEIYSVAFLGLGASAPIIRSFGESGRICAILLGGPWALRLRRSPALGSCRSRREGRFVSPNDG